MLIKVSQKETLVRYPVNDKIGDAHRVDFFFAKKSTSLIHSKSGEGENKSFHGLIFRLQFPCLPKGGVWLVCFFRWAGTCSVASCVNFKTHWVFVKLLVTKSTRKPHWVQSVGFSFDLFVFRDLIITFFCVNARQEKKKRLCFVGAKQSLSNPI